MTEADAFTGPVDEAGNVGHDEAAVIGQIDDAEDRVEGRKVIGCNFWLGCRNLSQDARFADAGIAQEADVSQDFQFQPQPPFFSRFAPFGKGRRPIGTRSKMPVAATAAAAFSDDGLLAVPRQVGHDLARFFIFYDRSQRNGNQQVFGVSAVLIAAFALSAGLGLEQAAKTKVDEGVDVAVSDENDVAALTAVAAVRSALGDELFMPETAHAVAALAGLYKNSCSVYKHRSPHMKIHGDIERDTAYIYHVSCLSVHQYQN